MLKRVKNGLYLVLMLVFAQNCVADSIQIQIRSNKTEFICGEPVLLKTTVSNLSSENFMGNSPGYAWGRTFGYSMYIAYDGNDFSEILDVNTKLRLKVSTPPMQYDFFRDRHRLLNTLPAWQQAERLDMLIFPKPGDYSLKAVLKERDGKAYTSRPIQFRVLPLKEKYDSVSQLGNQNFLVNLGSSIYYAHYVEMIWGGYPPGKSVCRKEFEKIAPQIIKSHTESVFREYVMYANIMTNGGSVRGGRKLIKPYKELAERFVKEYPKSWLLPEVYRKLFWTYVADKDKEKAEAARDKVLQIAPNAVVLRHVKKADLSKLGGSN